MEWAEGREGKAQGAESFKSTSRKLVESLLVAVGLHLQLLGRRKDPTKTTYLRSRIDDVRSEHQIGTLTGMPLVRSRRALPLPGASILPQSSIACSRQANTGACSRSVLLPCSVNLPQKAECTFPLSSDHLITLTVFNVHRALLTNTILLGVPNVFVCDGESDTDVYCVTSLPLVAEVPASLQPTHLQASVPHPPWIDTFPNALVRDTLIRNIGLFNDDELCMNILGTLVCNQDAGLGKYQRDDNGELDGMIVWADSWDVKSWELTKGFLSKWGWIFREAWEDILEAANYWRGLREEMLLRLRRPRELRVV